MTLAEIIEKVQYTVDQRGKVTAVVLSPELWQRVLESLEDAEERARVSAPRGRLVQGHIEGDALRWQDIAESWQ